MLWIILLIGSIISFFTWLIIHEMSHILMAKALLDVTEWKITPYPHSKGEGENKRWVFASASWKYQGEYTPKQRAAVALAPRIPNLLAVAMAPFGLLFTPTWGFVWAVFWTVGIIGLIVGLIGKSEFSDLNKAAVNLDISPWVLRIPGFGLALASLLPTLVVQIPKLLF